jgi:hypothetical protein
VPSDARFGIEPVTYVRHDGTQSQMYFIVDLVDGRRVRDPTNPGLLLGFDSEEEAQAKCDELNRLSTKPTDSPPDPGER